MSKSESKTSGIWDPETDLIPDAPSLETVIDKVIQDELIREKASDETAVCIRSLPWKTWDAVKYLSLKPHSKILEMKSVAEGCLLHAGLFVIERVMSQSSRTKERWLKAVENDDEDTTLDYIRTRYTPEYMGKGIGVTRKIFFLSQSDRARAMEISSIYGYSLSQVATLSLIAGIGLSESILPKHLVNMAQKEVDRFRRDWK